MNKNMDEKGKNISFIYYPEHTKALTDEYLSFINIQGSTDTP